MQSFLNGIPSVLVPNRDGLETLVHEWGMQPPAGIVRYIGTSDDSPLIDSLPGLRCYLPESTWQTPLQPCERLWFEPSIADAETIDLTFARAGERLCFVTAIAPLDLIKRVAADLGVDLSGDELWDASQYARREERRLLVEEVRAIDDVPGKLIALVGASDLLEGLAAGVQQLLIARKESDSALHIARTAVAVYGIDVLRSYAGSLAKRGLEPPINWGGGARAQELVDELGFPAEYAGFRRRRRDATWDVDGAIELKPLHRFQETIALRIQELLGKSKPERGLLSLPTGSGKTRVVVQALVKAISAKEVTGALIWIAQSDELCEQAVQSWAEVWRALGPRQRLRISRLWGSTNNRIVKADAPHVVVATYQTLVSRLRLQTYDWLLDASCIIVDEAHGSIAPSYTEILDRFGLTARETSRPLIGVTATPFRSAADPAETQWLVNRYGKHRFDHGVLPGDDPYTVLQGMGVLARVDQQTLEGDNLTLSESELGECPSRS